MKHPRGGQGTVGDGVFHFSTTVKVCLAESFKKKKVIWDGVRALCSQSLSSNARLVNILCRRHGGCLGLLVSTGDAEAPR